MNTATALHEAMEHMRKHEYVEASNALQDAWQAFQRFEKRHNQLLLMCERRYSPEEVADALVGAAEEGHLSVGRTLELLAT